MTSLGVYERTVLSFLLWLTILAPCLLCSEFYVAYVTEHSLNICQCMRELPHCSEPDASECSCENHRPDGGFASHRLAVWYSSPLHVALLLHNAEVRHLSLVRCCCGWTAVPSGGISAVAAISMDMATGGNAATATGKMGPPPDHFVVQRLERLTVWPPADQAGSHHQDLLLGRELGAAHHEEPRIAVINTSILVGAPTLKAYTVCTGLDAEGGLPFPNLPMLPRLPRELLPDSSSIFVTFLY